MSCDKTLYVRAGDAWSVTFKYTFDGAPIPLPSSARAQIRDAAGNVLLTLTPSDGLTIDAASGEIEAAAAGNQTFPLAIGGKRSELVFALKIFDAGDEDATGETIAVAQLIASPRMVSA